MPLGLLFAVGMLYSVKVCAGTIADAIKITNTILNKRRALLVKSVSQSQLPAAALHIIRA